MLIRALHEVSGKLDREELCLLTDEELFQKLSSDECGSAFTKEVVASIRGRRLYHSIPMRVTANSDLDAEGQRIWAEYATGLPGTLDKVLKVEQDSARRVSLPQKFRVIFDVAPIPITKPEAYSTKYFYDPETKQTKSLKELLPHLEFTHGKVMVGNQALDLYEQYRREVSRLYIFLPFDFLHECVEDIYSGLPVATPVATKDLFSRRTVSARDYSKAREGSASKLRAVAEAFARDLFNLHAPHDSELITRITKAGVGYLDLIFRERYPEVSISES
jgi:hypothetical protein